MENELILLGQRIAYLRKKNDITQEKLAEYTHYSPNHISKLELAGTNPSFELLVKIANALNIELKELFDFKEETNNCIDFDSLSNYILEDFKTLSDKEKKFIYQTIQNLKELK